METMEIKKNVEILDLVDCLTRNQKKLLALSELTADQNEIFRAEGLAWIFNDMVTDIDQTLKTMSPL